MTLCLRGLSVPSHASDFSNEKRETRNEKRLQSTVMLLAGDVGGTKTFVGLFERAATRPVTVDIKTFSTQQYASLGDIIDAYLVGLPAVPRLDAACFGVAGPVIEGTATLTNVPWQISAADVVQRFGVRHVGLLNDLESMAYSVAVLEPDELAIIQRGVPRIAANAAVIAAGTGLGEAFLHWIDGRFYPAPSEGGHADFAPHTERQIALLRMLTQEFGRAEWEHVISGPGLVNVHRFTHGVTPCRAADLLRVEPDVAAAISASALEGRCDACVEALQIFVQVYGAEAGNLALRSVAGAVFLGGGIAPKILPALQDGSFVRAFTAKGPMRDLLAAVPVHVILNPQAGLIGAAVYADGMT